MDFGLGLVLSLTDNATAGLNNAVNTLNQLTDVAGKASASLNEMASLSALSVVSNQIGSSFLKAGSSILGVFSNLLGSVQRTGSDFEMFRVTLNALYGDAEKAESAITKLLDFSIKSPFEVDGVKDMLIVLQSQGVDAFNEVTGTISGMRQETLSWISDLMSFKPDEATSRWKRALTNYIGSGEVRMLRNILDMGDIDQILGHNIGATAEERLNDIIEIVEKKNLQGLSENLAKTWQGVMSNLADAYTKLYKSIADNGVFDTLKNSLMSVSGAILSLDNEKLEALGKTIAEGLNAIMTPITYVTDKLNKLINYVVDLCQTNPDLVKVAMIAGAIVGALSLLMGVFFKFASAMANVNILILTFGKAFSKIGSVVKVGSLKVLGSLIPLTATLGMLYFAWKNDIGGIKTHTINFATKVVTSFKAVNGSMREFSDVLHEAERNGDNFTLSVMRVIQFIDALADAWNDDELSEDNYLKAKRLGILPLIGAILQLKRRFEFFKEGFIAGWKEIGEKAEQSLKGFLEKVDGTFLGDILNSLNDFLMRLSSGDTQAWYDWGVVLADITASLMLLKGLFSVVGFVVKLASSFKILGGVLHFAYKALAFVGEQLFNVLGWVVSKVPSVLSFAWGVIKGFFGLLGKAIGAIPQILSSVVKFFGTAFGGITLVIGGVITAVASFIDMFKNGFSWIKEILMVVGIALATVGAIILGAPALVAGVIGAIVAGIATAVIVIKEHWEGIKTFFAKTWDWIGETFNTILTGAVNLFFRWAFGKINGFIKAINFAIGIINAIPGVNISKLTELAVPQLAQGGVVSKPTTAIIGEAGAEAVVPLENNTQWLGRLANMLATEIHEMRPSTSRMVSSSGSQSSSSRYLTSSSSTPAVQGSTSNSVVIQNGAIQINVQKATDEEANRLAKKILEYIKRQQQLDRMTSYA